MKLKYSDLLVNTLEDFGIEKCFSVTGGTLAHILNSMIDSKIEIIFLRTEQACAMAADAYARVAKKPALVLVTNGPGVSNTITGALGAYQDSIPMIIISGQNPTNQIILEDSKLRQIGVQEAKVDNLVKDVTKSFYRITTNNLEQEILLNGFSESVSGRNGPVWFEVPIDIQSKISTYTKKSIKPRKESSKISEINKIKKLMKLLKASKRPIVVVGNGVHISSTEEYFLKFITLNDLPFISTWLTSDIIEFTNENYIGNFGMLGTRAANLAVQTSDLVLVLGSRLSIPNTGYNSKNFASIANVVHVDIDVDELNKKTLNTNLKINLDLETFFKKINKSSITFSHRDNIEGWKKKLLILKNKFDISKEDHFRSRGAINSYDFIDTLSNSNIKNSIILTDMGTSFTCTMQALKNSGKNRLITASGTSSMGFGLPGAIGAYYADPSKNIICIAGDGGFQMNLQELQTLIQYNIPIKIFILNNNGYLAISIMQDNLFKGRHIGSTKETGVSSPDFYKLAKAFGIKTKKYKDLFMLSSDIDKILNSKDSFLVEITQQDEQFMMPRLQSTKNADGSITSGTLENMWPHLEADELDMIIQDLID
jgi:acetolactate synthase I/II/III large subunit